MIRRPPRSTQSRSSAASDVYKRQAAYVPPSPRTLAQRAGDAAEDDVAARLSARGWRILGRRVRAGRSELDLVAVDPGPPRTLVIVEVRWRRRRDFGLPEETVDHRKLAHLRG